MIYFDPSEQMQDTHIPSTFFDFSSPLPGLEHWTGADFLITARDTPVLKKVTSAPPFQAILQGLCECGELVQRKSGQDFLHSITNHKLPDHFLRMREWVSVPRLLVSGIRYGSGGQLILDGKWQSTSWTWVQVNGAIHSWQDRGGSVTRLEYDSLITEWAAQREKQLIKCMQEPEKSFSKSYRQEVSRERENWVWTLGAWPKGIGVKKLIALAQYLEQVMKIPPTLSNAISLALSREVLNVEGWGKKSLESVQAWYGVAEFDIGNTITIRGKRYIIDAASLGTRDQPMQLPKGAIVLTQKGD